jgi:hypothetical protein
MLEIILILCILFLILTFFYKQAICEFRINQITWIQRDTISGLLMEKVPIVIKAIPLATFWTQRDTLSRACYKSIPVFKDTTLVEWISTSSRDSICPWKYSHAATIASVSGIHIWAKRGMNSMIINPLLRLWVFPRYHCWAGNVGLRKTSAPWTCLFPVDGDIVVTIMYESIESSLPTNWMGCFPSKLTINDTPFISDIKFIDIVLRTGNALFIPSHWFVSWVASEKCDIAPMTCTISYHTPISLFAHNMSPNNR